MEGEKTIDKNQSAVDQNETQKQEPATASAKKLPPPLLSSAIPSPPPPPQPRLKFRQLSSFVTKGTLQCYKDVGQQLSYVICRIVSGANRQRMQPKQIVAFSLEDYTSLVFQPTLDSQDGSKRSSCYPTNNLCLDVWGNIAQFLPDECILHLSSSSVLLRHVIFDDVVCYRLLWQRLNSATWNHLVSIGFQNMSGYYQFFYSRGIDARQLDATAPIPTLSRTGAMIPTFNQDLPGSSCCFVISDCRTAHAIQFKAKTDLESPCAKQKNHVAFTLWSPGAVSIKERAVYAGCLSEAKLAMPSCVTLQATEVAELVRDVVTRRLPREIRKTTYYEHVAHNEYV